MKLILSFVMLVSYTIAHAADFESKIELVHKTTTRVTVKLNKTTVLCSAADYSGPFLKVHVPELSKLTLLNHQNAGAGQPCVAAGQCSDSLSSTSIIDKRRPSV